MPTIIEVVYPASRGKIGLRGNQPPLSWEHTQHPARVEGDRSIFEVEVPEDGLLEIKLVRDDGEWASGRNYAVHAGDHLVLQPCFESERCALEGPFTLESQGPSVTYEVLLPPSYAEQEGRRYPVLYVLDGQSLWSTSADPFGVWHLDRELEVLFELDAMEEVIVVGVHTAIDRMRLLSPVPDPQHGGGDAKLLLATLVDGLKPAIDARYRTKPDANDTAIMGSSMGGLFAFGAAWERSDVFGKAACLSSSFWWANREAIRRVQRAQVPEPRPTIYIDSGAAIHAAETDPSLRDGFHHTRSMFRALLDKQFTPGTDLHWLVFTSASHDAVSWRSRVAIPLQTLFPPQFRRPAAARVTSVAASSRS